MYGREEAAGRDRAVGAPGRKSAKWNLLRPSVAFDGSSEKEKRPVPDVCGREKNKSK